ncbi:olfactory receptor 14C36-like [Porphyrio hochstetteri]
MVLVGKTGGAALSEIFFNALPYTVTLLTLQPREDLKAIFLEQLLVSTLETCDHRLHTPMFFFLLNLSVLDLGCISTTVPKAMANSLWDTRAISYTGCVAQLFFFLFLIITEFYLLTFFCEIPQILKLSCSDDYLRL